MRTIELADLFCGAGGTSTGALRAIQDCGFHSKLTAVNHWPVAVKTHETNHPGARHFCASLDSLNPRQLFPSGRLDLLWASPECTHHSRARGGKPMSDQSRATGHCVTRWAEALRPHVILVENVLEFKEWGPLGRRGKPLKRQKGKTFEAWIGMLRGLGYDVDHRVLCAADFGDPTTRKRLFVQAVRSGGKIQWPEPTHANDGGSSGRLSKWVAAREVIDWEIPGQSIFSRKRPLKPKTLSRIFNGLKKFGMEPMVVGMEHKGSVRTVETPLPTITTARCGAMALVQPYLVKLRGTNESQVKNSARSVEDPLSAITAGGGHFGLVEPCLLPQQTCGVLRPVSQPCPTVSTSGAIALIEPYLVKYYGTADGQSLDEPLHAVTAKPRFGLAMPEVIVDGEAYRLDIRFRMLQPHELAGAQGFPTGYQFAGTKTEVVRQIGNAVPCNMAQAIVRSALDANRRFWK